MWRRREKTGTALYDESGCNMDMTRRSPGCGSQRLLRCRSHPAGRGPNSSSLFPPLAAVVVVAPKGRGFGISEYLYTPKAPGGYPPGAFGIDRTMTGE